MASSNEGFESRPGSQLDTDPDARSTRTSFREINMINEYEYKIFKDPVHGHIKLHPLCVKIIDTPQFQRLRNIKKLGGNYQVYPGAAHNQFEHVLGTCHLAGEMIRSLRSNQPDIGITQEDILCVEIAGLCRNLGSGPFSNVFYELFLPKTSSPPKLCDVSVKMMQYLLESNAIDLEAFHLVERDVTFIKEAIAGPKDGRYEGRKEDKRFLYQIVAPNDGSGIEVWDVALWDSLARDSYHVGIRSPFDHWRLMKFSRVIEDPTDQDKMSRKPLTKICYREKEVDNLYDMMHAHQILMRKALLHKTVVAIEEMMTEAFLAANASSDAECKISAGNSMYKISECIDEMEAFTKLDDTIYHKILNSTSSEEQLGKARGILENIQKRKIYKHLGGTKPKKDHKCTNNDVEEMEQTMIKSQEIEAEHFFLKLINIDYGKDANDPMEDVRFYKKMQPNRPIQITRNDVSHMLPEYFRDQIIFLYSRNRVSDQPEVQNEKITAAFRKMCEKNTHVHCAKFCDRPRQPSECTE